LRNLTFIGSNRLDSMKAIIYHEGDSERIMFKYIFYRSHQQINIPESYMDFITAPDDTSSFGNWVYFYDCGGYQNVFPRISETEYLYRNNVTVIIVRDLENVICFRLLKQQLESDWQMLPPFPRTRVVFSKKTFEQVYFANLELLKDVVCRLHAEHFGIGISDINLLDEQIGSLDREKPNLRWLFKRYNMAYKKLDVADNYFSRFDFNGSNHPYIARLMGAIDELIS